MRLRLGCTKDLCDQRVMRLRLGCTKDLCDQRVMRLRLGCTKDLCGHFLLYSCGRDFCSVGN